MNYRALFQLFRPPDCIRGEITPEILPSKFLSGVRDNNTSYDYYDRGEPERNSFPCLKNQTHQHVCSDLYDLKIKIKR